ncbi:MAG TPA: DUF559 domain-containing protein [Solirubrobacteraceae bacterium]
MTPITKSELEDLFLALIRETDDIPEPQANVLIEGEWVDFVWVKQKLVVEVDGYQWHKTRADFEKNRRRDTKLQLAGYRVMRPTAQRIVHEPSELRQDIIQLLKP